METQKHTPIVVSQLRDTPPPTDLVGTVLAHLARLERRQALVRAYALGVLCILSCFGSVQAFFYTLDEMYLSGFGEFAHLLLGGFAWRETAIALIETLPALPLALVCTALLVFIWSLARSARNFRIAMRQNHILQKLS